MLQTRRRRKDQGQERAEEGTGNGLRRYLPASHWDSSKVREVRAKPRLVFCTSAPHCTSALRPLHFHIPADHTETFCCSYYCGCYRMATSAASRPTGLPSLPGSFLDLVTDRVQTSTSSCTQASHAVLASGWAAWTESISDTLVQPGSAAAHHCRLSAFCWNLLVDNLDYATD